MIPARGPQTAFYENFMFEICDGNDGDLCNVIFAILQCDICKICNLCYAMVVMQSLLDALCYASSALQSA